MFSKTLAGAVAMFALAVSTTVAAQTFDKRTFFTFTNPVALPGVTLAPGTYEFRILDDTTTRRTIEVLNAAGTQSYAILSAIPAERYAVSMTPQVRFGEAARGMPVPVKVWWYPGESIGYEFIYSRAQMHRLASGAVPVTDSRS